MRSEGVLAPWKGALAVGGFTIFWFNLLVALFPDGKPASEFSLTLVPGLVAGALFALAPVLLFMFVFVSRTERKSLKSAVSSVGLNRNGVKKSLLWSVPFFVLILVSTSLMGAVVVQLFGPTSVSYPYQGGLPVWYAFFTLVYSVFSSLTEETIGVGYIVDRLMPAHPSGLAVSTPAVLSRSVVAVLYHVGTYLVLWQLSPVTAALNFVTAFLSFTLIGFAYVKSRARTVAGPWAMHYAFDVIAVLTTYHL